MKKLYKNVRNVLGNWDFLTMIVFYFPPVYLALELAQDNATNIKEGITYGLVIGYYINTYLRYLEKLKNETKEEK